MRVLLACAGVFSAAAVAHAGEGGGLGNSDLFWTTFGSGSYFDPSNWSEPRVPTAFDLVIFKNEAEYTVTCGIPATVDRLSIRQGYVTFELGGGSIGSINTNGALSTIVGEIEMDNAYAIFRDGRFQPVGITLGLVAGSQGTAAHKGSSTRFLPGGPVVIGEGGDGTIAFEAGARALLVDPAITTTLGAQQTGSGAISLFNTNTRWTSSGRMDVGLRGVGSINMGDHASLITGETRVAVHSGSMGSLQMLDANATINGALLLGVGDGVQDFGVGLLTVGGSSVLTAHSVRVGALSTVTGNALIRSDVTSTGAIRVGDLSSGGPMPGVLTIDGDLTLLEGARFFIDLGEGPSDERLMASDRLHVTGHAHLDGALFVDVFFGAAPLIGDRFDILTAASRSGRFDEIALPALEGDLSWRVRYSDTGAQLRVIPAPSALAVLAALGAPIRRRR